MMVEDFKPFVELLCRESGEMLMKYYRQKDLAVESKADLSPVTRADRETESYLREQIHRRYPEHGVIGEEFGDNKPDAEYVWVLDPIDGTIAFTSGCPLFGTLIGLLQNGKPILGAIHHAALGQLIIGDCDSATINGKPMRVRRGTALRQATLLTSDVLNIHRHQDAERFEALSERVKVFRTWGDCYGYTSVASGFADIMLDPIMNPWDLLPLIPVIQGAGGVITRWDGGDVLDGQSAVAASPDLHAEVIRLLNRTSV